MKNYKSNASLKRHPDTKNEIEDILRTHPKINIVAIIGKKDDVWGQIVVAFIKLEPAEKMSSTEVTDFCTSKIASFKKPRIIKFVNSLPLTKTGKLNRIEIKKQAENLT